MHVDSSSCLIVHVDSVDSRLQAGKLNHELDRVHIDIHTKLDELKREELNRLRSILKAKHAIAGEKGGVNLHVAS